MQEKPFSWPQAMLPFIPGAIPINMRALGRDIKDVEAVSVISAALPGELKLQVKDTEDF